MLYFEYWEEGRLKGVYAAFFALTEKRISIMKGLTGGYASRVTFYLPDAVRRVYLDVQERTIARYQLHLTEPEKRRLLYMCLEMYWSHRG